MTAAVSSTELRGCTYARRWILRGAIVWFWIDDAGANVEIDAFEAKHAPRQFTDNETAIHLVGPESVSAALLDRARRLAHRTHPRPEPSATEPHAAATVRSASGFENLDHKKVQKVPVARRKFVRGDHVELGKALVDELGGDVVCDELHAWKYGDEDGLWRQVDRSVESRIVQGFAGASYDDGKRLDISAGDVAGAIKLAHDQIARPSFFAEAPRGIVFSNGFLRITSACEAELLPHSPDHRARAGYPFAYEAALRPQRFLTFLGDLFRDDEDRLQKQLFVQEFFGACAIGIATTYQRCAIAKGAGDNGKSRLADIALASMPEGTTSAIPPQDWGQEYRRAMLVGKHLNAVGELPERDIIASEAFKAIVAGDPIVARVIRESPVMYRPIAGHYFAANALPGTSDQTEGFWRRFVVVTFNRSFKNDPSRDPHIAARILEEERPAIVAWFIDGALRLLRSREYTIPPSHHAAVTEWRRNADQVALFVEAEMRPLSVDEPIAWGTAAVDLYAAYRRWCEQNGHRPMASNKLGRRMKELGLAPAHTKKGSRYPLALMTSADRARVTDGDSKVTDYSSPKSREDARA